MQLHSHHKRLRDFTGHTCDLHPSARTREAVEIALERARVLLEAGRLISPGEALALAGPEARKDETLFSVARAVAAETEGDMDEILCQLGKRYPHLS